MRHLALTVLLVGACLFERWAGYDPITSPCRPLTPQETAGVRAGTFHYCSLPYPLATACSACNVSIHWVEIQMMPGMPLTWVNLYGKCKATPTDNWCWQTSYTGTPTPTCDLNQTACPGLMEYYLDAGCAQAYADPPYEFCSTHYSSGYKAATAGTAPVPCTGMRTLIFTD